MEVVIIIGIVALAIYVFSVYNKNEYEKLRDSSEKVMVKVEEIRRERVGFRNDFTKGDYAYVRVEPGFKGASRFEKLHFSTSEGLPFKIGDVVPAFWHDGRLLYSDA